RLTQSHRAWNHSSIDLCGKMLSHLRDDLCTYFGAAVEHRHDDAANFDLRVGARIAHLLNDPHNFYQAFERKIFALNRSENFIRGSKRVGHENAERWRTIEEYEVKSIILPERPQSSGQPQQMIFHSRNLHFRAC